MTDQTTDRSVLREQLLHALDFPYCQGLGYATPEELLAAYDASRAPAAADQTGPSLRAGLRDEIVNALGQINTVPPVAHRREQADHVLAVLYREWPWLRAEAEDAAPADQAALVRACASFVRDTYSGEWADDAAATLETDADRIERGEPCSLLHLAAVLPTTPGRRAVLLEGAAAIDATFTGPDTDRYARNAADLLRRMADETAATETQPERCEHCGQPISRVTGTLATWWVHNPGGNTVCDWARPAASPRATPKASAEARQDGAQR